MDAQNKKLRDDAALLLFIDDMLKERTDLHIEPEKLPGVRSALMREIDEAINTRLVSLLGDEQQNELTALLDRNATDEELDAFFDKHIVDEEKHIAAVLLEFRAAFLYGHENVSEPQKSEIPTQAAPAMDDSFADTPPPAPVAPASASPDQMLN